jgi:hypothetical protein
MPDNNYQSQLLHEFSRRHTFNLSLNPLTYEEAFDSVSLKNTKD